MPLNRIAAISSKELCFNVIPIELKFIFLIRNPNFAKEILKTNINMKKLPLLLLLSASLVTAGNRARAQNIYTFAGQAGSTGYTGNGGYAAAATMSGPAGIVTDTAGNVYFADERNNVVRKVNAAGIITVVAGNSTAGYTGDGAAATAAELRTPTGLALDKIGNLYIADNGNNVIRKVSATGTITTIAGTTGGYSGDGGPAISAQLRGPNGIAVDSTGKVYFADARNNVVRMINTDGIINTIAGNNAAGAGFSGDGGAATNAQMSRPAGLAVDAMGNVYVADSRNHVIRMVTPAGIISTIAGNYTMGAGFTGDGGLATAAKLRHPFAVSVDKFGVVFIADSSNNIRTVKNDTINTFAGSDAAGYYGDGGPATNAKMTTPDGIAFDNAHNVYVSCFGDNVIRRIGMPVPGITITSNEGDTTCYGRVNHYVATAVADTTPHYQWMINGIATGTDSFGFTPTGTLATGSIVSCELLAAAGGTVMAISNNLKIDSFPVNAPITGPTTVCVGNIVNYTHGAAGGPPPPGTWLSVNPSVGVFMPPNRLNIVGPGFDTLKFIATNVCGSDTSKIAITATANLYGPISGPSVVCAMSTANYTDTSAGGTWKIRAIGFGGLLGDAIDSLTGVFTAGFLGGPVIVSYGVPGCVVTDSINVVNLGAISGPSFDCFGNLIAFSDTSANGIWSVSPTTLGTIDSLGGGFTSGTTAGIATITYAVSSVCYTTTTVNVAAMSPIVGPSSICTTGTVTYTDSVAGGSWSANIGIIDPVAGAYSTTSGYYGADQISYTLAPGCTVVDSINIDSAVTVLPITGAYTVDSVWSTTLTDGTPGGVWTSSNPSIATVGSTTGIVTGISGGIATISYTVTNAGGCSTTVVWNIAVVNRAGVHNVDLSTVFNIYPNPAGDNLNVSWKNIAVGKAVVTIADMSGKVVMTAPANMQNASGEMSLNVNSLPNGVYLLEIATEAGTYHGKVEIAK